MKITLDYIPVETSSGTIYRPGIFVTVFYGERKRVYEFIIDSGADYSLIQKEHALELGMDFETGKKKTIKGICRHGMDCVEKKVQLSVAGFDEPFESSVYVSKDIHLTTNLLGRDNFFEHYLVGFDQKGKKISLDDRRKFF